MEYKKITEASRIGVMKAISQLALTYLIIMGILLGSFWLYDNHQDYQTCKAIESISQLNDSECHYFGEKDYLNVRFSAKDEYSESPTISFYTQDKLEESKNQT